VLTLAITEADLWKRILKAHDDGLIKVSTEVLQACRLENLEDIDELVGYRVMDKTTKKPLDRFSGIRRHTFKIGNHKLPR